MVGPTRYSARWFLNSSAICARKFAMSSRGCPTIAERERQTGRSFVGIATDGAEFITYEVRGGNLVEISRYVPSRADPAALLAWLEPALANRDDLTPDPLTVERGLGRASQSFGRARGVLERLWGELRDHSEVLLKRQLWDGLLREAY